MDIKISGSPQAPALGSAIFGALAAGKEKGGYDDIKEAAANMGKLKDITYTPNAENAAVYEKLYAEYKELVHYFGKESYQLMLLKLQVGSQHFLF